VARVAGTEEKELKERLSEVSAVRTVSCAGRVVSLL